MSDESFTHSTVDTEGAAQIVRALDAAVGQTGDYHIYSTITES